ncbi:MAG: UDP-N-acetylmuramoylalanyl-D-glutamyl-2, 6-diaminopimelate--D-alanyl-D-alanine ligase, partial [Bdellovibrionales bacterium]|nr:UDP-N-acetylmuramoylalanyl-D-glutamyl-2, 6-diaminopimelate--D-alanyl-D-alanine ligase [Bdellovibrionales bacterium]
MPEFSLDWIARTTKGQIKSRVYASGKNIGTDTREDLSQKVFIALRGANFDAHDFVDKAIAQGAHILILDKENICSENLLEKTSVILVKDTLQALQDMAHSWRHELAIKVVGITGSNGKTTTKEFAATLLKSKFKVFANPGNFNNHWGLPLSLLKVEKSEQIAILEMGMSRRGEITRLCEIADPDVVLVTMVGSAHIGELGSQQEIANAKAEIYSGCETCTKIFNLDNEYTISMYKKFLEQGGGDHLTFSSFDKDTTVSLRVEKMAMGS